MSVIALNNISKIAFISDLHLDSNTPPSRIDDILETTIKKMNFILKECISRGVQVVLFEGDLVNRVTLPYKPINDFMEVLRGFKDANILLYSICGNHDIIYNSMDYLNRSPLQTLFASGLITHINLESPVVINKSVLITPVDYTEIPVKANEAATYNILLYHGFINASEYMADPKHNLDDNAIKALGYDLIMAGHDHQEYPNLKVGKTLIIRNGSLLRGTSHDYNFKRKPNFIVLNDLSNICEDTIEKVVVEHKPYTEIASNYVVNKENMGSISGLKDMLSNLADKLTMSSEVDEDRILNIIKSDEQLPNEARLKLLNYIAEMN